MAMSLKKTGWPETQAGFDALRNLINDTATRAAIRAGGAVFRDEEIRSAPVLDKKTARSNALDPGALRAGIKINRVRKVSEHAIEAEIGPRKGTRRAAHLVEFGHRLVRGGKSHVGPRGPEGPGKVIGEVPEHPFLRPAYEAVWRKAIEEFGAELKRQLGRYVKP